MPAVVSAILGAGVTRQDVEATPVQDAGQEWRNAEGSEDQSRLAANDQEPDGDEQDANHDPRHTSGR